MDNNILIDLNISLFQEKDCLLWSSSCMEKDMIDIVNIKNNKDSKSTNIINQKTIETIAYSLVDGVRVFALNHKVSSFINLDKKIHIFNNSILHSNSSTNKDKEDDYSLVLYDKIVQTTSGILLSTMTPTHHIENTNKLNKDDIFANTNNSVSSLKTKDFRLLTRVTFSLSERKDLVTLSSIDTSYIDIMAVELKNDTNFEFLCTDVHTDILTISCKENINFYTKKKSVLSAIKRDVFLEFSYNDLLNSDTRSIFIHNFTILYDITKGKNIILSSGASVFTQQRSPYDVLVMMETIFKIDKSTATTFIYNNPERAVRNGLQRKFYKNIINLEEKK